MRAEEAWAEYVAFLRLHVPAAHANLAAGAAPAAIADLERTLGFGLPEGLKAVWRQNDGQKNTMLADSEVIATPCVPTLSFLSVRWVGQIWQTWSDLRARLGEASLAELDARAGSEEEGVVRPVYTCSKWVPLWADPSRADYIGLDFDPGQRGRVGQAINFGRNEDHHWACADDFEDLLGFLLDEVRAGKWGPDVLLLDGAEIPYFGAPSKNFFNVLRRRSRAREG